MKPLQSKDAKFKGYSIENGNCRFPGTSLCKKYVLIGMG